MGEAGEMIRWRIKRIIFQTNIILNEWSMNEMSLCHVSVMYNMTTVAVDARMK